MFGADFNLVTRDRLPYSFEHWKDGSLQINILALNNCFSHRNIFQNDVNALSKMFFKNPVCCQKAQNFVEFGSYNFAQISPGGGRNILYGSLWRDFRLPTSALATVAQKVSNGKFTAKIDFPIGYFILPLPKVFITKRVRSLKLLKTTWTT